MNSLSSVALVGLLAGTSLASGLRLYATVAVLGYLGRAGMLDLPGDLAILANPWVIGTAAALYLSTHSGATPDQVKAALLAGANSSYAIKNAQHPEPLLDVSSF